MQERGKGTDVMLQLRFTSVVGLEKRISQNPGHGIVPEYHNLLSTEQYTTWIRQKVGMR
jgi:hypothetical protein